MGVSGKFGRPRGLLPPVDFGVDSFHRKIGTLDQPHLDPRSTGCSATVRPLDKTLKSGKRIGQVGLQDDARLQMTQFGAVEEPLKDLNCQIKVVVLLHVEIDELWFRGGCSQVVQRQ